MADPTPRRRTLREAVAAHKAATPAEATAPPDPKPAVKPAKAKKKGKAPPPGPDAAGNPWCPGCKAHHRPPTSKDDWRALACQGTNPFPAPKRPTHTGPARDRALAAKGRLPDGSAFAVAYAAASRSWAGTLSFPDGRPGKDPLKTFRGEAPGVFGLLVYLDKKFRAWAERHPDHPALAEHPGRPW